MAMQKQQISAGHFPKVRIYCQFEGAENAHISLDKDQAHYLGKVLRKAEGDEVGLFNQVAGEWRCEITSLRKSEVQLKMVDQVRQPETLPDLELVFCPLRKERMAFLIEKSVELGVTHLQPVISDFTNWKFNAEKMTKTIMEAVEQCERVDLPTLAAPIELPTYLQSLEEGATVYAAIERRPDTPRITSLMASLRSVPTPPRLLIGPEGGWSPHELQALASNDKVQSISLGKQILRAETAGITGLVLLQSSRHII